MSIDFAAMRTRLTERLDKLSTRVQGIEKDLRRQMEADWAEQAQRAENDEVLEGLDNQGLAEIASIRVALQRLDDGSYGMCVRCGEDIPERRLDLLPFVTTCVNCA